MKNPTKKILIIIIIATMIFGGILGTIFVYEKNHIKVSVIVPVYNVEPWLRKCLDNLIDQTLKEIEIICINDGSTDNSKDILEEYSRKDSRITVITQENKGVSVARNRGLEIAKGEYISFIDSDDYINLKAYDELYKLAKKNNDDIIEFGKRWFMDETNETIKNFRPKKDAVIKINSNEDLRNLIWDVFVINKLYKRELIEENNIRFVESVRMEEDLYFNLMCLPHIRIYETRKNILLNYRRREGSATVNINNFDDLRSCIDGIKPVCDEWKKAGAIKGNEDYLLSYMIDKFYWIYEPIIKKDGKYANEVISALGSELFNDNVIEKCGIELKRRADFLRKMGKYSVI